jgi:hypothetical protein
MGRDNPFWQLRNIRGLKQKLASQAGKDAKFNKGGLSNKKGQPSHGESLHPAKKGERRITYRSPSLLDQFPEESSNPHQLEVRSARYWMVSISRTRC